MPKSPTRPTQYPSPQWARALHRGKPRHSCRGGRPPTLGQESLRAIQRSREVQRGRAEQLGLTSNLIGLVPAVMSRISISIEFILDKENRLAVLGGLINDDSFL